MYIHLFIWLFLYTHENFVLFIAEHPSPRIALGLGTVEGLRNCGMNICFMSLKFRRVLQAGKEKTVFREELRTVHKSPFQVASGVQVISLGPFLAPSTKRWPPGLPMLPGWMKLVKVRKGLLL